MGRILPKKKFFKSSIYSPQLNVGSHIDNVKYSLEHLIFLNAREAEEILFRKRIIVAVLLTLISIVVVFFLSPKGQADVATFYPTACLGGWNNPRNAEGEPEATSDNPDGFTIENSAVLPTATNADVYCGNFVGTIEQNTKPTKMIVTLAWATKSEGEVVVDEVVTPPETLLDASTTEVLLNAASSTDTGLTSASSSDIATSTLLATSTGGIVESEIVVATSTEDTETTLEKVVSVVQGVFEKIFGGNDATPPVATSTQQESVPTQDVNGVTPTENTATTEVPLPVETASPVTPETTAPAPAAETPSEPVSTETPPLSFFEKTIDTLLSPFFNRVFAEESDGSTTTPSVSSDTPAEVITSENNSTTLVATGTKDITVATTTTVTASSSLVVATSTGDVLGTSTDAFVAENVTNEFLEVLYTFDGVVWNSLGKVDETSIKYRTFEIPVTASTTWDDMRQLQIKIQVVQRIDATPSVYLDGIKVEVLYETPVTHEHPDFIRDTILQDEVIGGVRIVRIINNDTNKEEIWYMYPEEVVSATSTDVVVSSSTDITSASSTGIVIDTINATGTMVTGTSTPVENSTTKAMSGDASSTQVQEQARPVVKVPPLKNKWIKLESSEVTVKGIEVLIKEIEEVEKKKEYILPDFTKDTIKKVSGSSLHQIVVQIEQEGVDSLWLFDAEKNTQERVDVEGKATFSKTYPFGIKGDTVFWLSEDGLVLYRYDITTKSLENKQIPVYDISLGERGEVWFEDIALKVIVGADKFSFYTEETGEVFSDDNLTTGEAFRVKEKLDTLLTRDKLEELNFVVTKAPQE